MSEVVKTKRVGGILEVTLDRPKANAIDLPTSRIMGETFREFRDNPDLRVAIVSTAGDKFFSAGWDLKAAADGDAVDADYGVGGFAGLQELRDLNKPVIAAVNGVAMGGGFEIALACDIIVASENAVFALPEPRVGLAAMAGGMHRLPRQIGLKRAMGMLLTGRRVSAAEGLELGFVNEVVPQAELLDAARRWAEQIMECAPLSVRASKQSAMEGLAQGSIEQAMSQRYDQLYAMLKSKDFVEGPRAFAEKRKPNWQGK